MSDFKAPLGKRMRVVLQYFGFHGVLYVVALFLIFISLSYVLHTMTYDLRVFVSMSTSVGGIEFLEQSESKKQVAIILGGVFLLFGIVFQWIVSRSLRDELDIFRVVLSRSSTTNMLINSTVFRMPQLNQLANSYNTYVRQKMKDYNSLTDRLIEIEDLRKEAQEEKLKNERLFEHLPVPVYAAYRDKLTTISYANKNFLNLLGPGSDFLGDHIPEISCLGGGADEINSVHENTVSVIESQRSSVCMEYRTYMGEKCLYEVRREPIVDAQGVCLMVLVVLIERKCNDERS